MKTIKIGNKWIGEDKPVFIVAELSCNHCQKYDLAVKTIKAIAKAGADAVKLQTYTPDSLSLNIKNKYFQEIKEGLWKGIIPYKLYEKAYTPWNWFPKLKKLAESFGLICFSAPFDFQAVDFLVNLKMPAYKIGSLEITDIPLIEKVASNGKPIIISTGIATIDDIRLAVNSCRRQKNQKVVLLKCVSAYPTPLTELNLRSMITLKKKFKTLIGISDHTLSLEVAIAAVSLGARVIEKHFILSRKLPSLDKDFSLEPKEFKLMVDSIRKVEKVLGTLTYKLSNKARQGRDSRRSLFIIQDIKRGETFTDKNIRSLRPGNGLHPKYWQNILGKKAKFNIKKGTTLNWRMLNNS